MRKPSAALEIDFSDRQLQVLAEATARWNILVGATRSGKTYFTYYLIALRLAELPPGNVLLVAKTLGKIEDNILGPMRKLFPGCVGHISGGLTRMVTLFGRECRTVGANDERAKEKIQGGGLVYAYGDEIALWPESFFQMLKSRLSDDGAIFDGTCNPDHPSHWLKAGMLDKADELDVRSWHFTIFDNPFISPDFVKKLCAEYTGVWYQRFILGLWVAGEGAIYDMLDTSVHVVDKLPAMSAYYIGIDYGTSSVSTFWLLGIGVDRKLYFVDFWRWDATARHRQLSDAECAEELDKWIGELKVDVKTVVIPHDAASLIAEIKRSQRGGRLQRIKRMAWADQSPGSVIMGLRELGTLFSRKQLLFSREIERKGGMAEWTGYTWDSKAAAKGEGDQPIKKDDHSPDAGRYVCMHAKSIWSRWLYASNESRLAA